MKISQRFSLDVDQRGLEFVDIDTDKDIKLYIDPCWIHLGEGQWYRDASSTLIGFFDYIIELYENEKMDKARELFDFAHEPNETCFGVSKNRPQGTGASEEMLSELFETVLQGDLIDLGFIERLEDMKIFVENFGPDRLSDLVTNIIRKHLSDFTIEQCRIHGIPLEKEPEIIGSYWNNEERCWEDWIDYALKVDGKIRLLVPKKIAVKSYKYTATEYCTHHVLVRRQEEHLKENSGLVIRRKDGTPKVTKVSIRKKEIKSEGLNEKKYVLNMSYDYPELIEQFRASIPKVLKDPVRTNKLTDEELMDLHVENAET
ncbi:hypothetical protein [Priestia filamentosa]|uniref:hypothetical protein n=1 Tax=Priestia filamentosa TaxID=1402861 RepID=UPI0039827EA1